MTDGNISKQDLMLMHAKFSEIDDLLELVQADGSIHDLDQYDEDSMQTTLGAVLCGLMKRLEKAENALREIVKDDDFRRSARLHVGDRGGEYATTARKALQ